MACPDNVKLASYHFTHSKSSRALVYILSFPRLPQGLYFPEEESIPEDHELKDTTQTEGP